MNGHTRANCCDDLFTKFTFQDLRSALPPNRKGVYVIRVKKEGSSVRQIVKQAKQLLQNLKWELVQNYILNRIRRLERIRQCPIVYIGSAGTQKHSKNTLKGRYREFSLRHTAMYPIWALLYFNWDLEFGWRETEDPGRVESQLKQQYKERHGNRLPAIVQE